MLSKIIFVFLLGGIFSLSIHLNNVGYGKIKNSKEKSVVKSAENIIADLTPKQTVKSFKKTLLKFVENGKKPKLNLGKRKEKKKRKELYDEWAIYPLKIKKSKKRKTQGLHGLHDKNAIDLEAPVYTPVLAIADGTVIDNSWNETAGNRIVIRHNNGVESLSCHFVKRSTLRVGQKVRQGEIIAYSGNTGHSTGPHLHIHIKGAQNPFRNIRPKKRDLLAKR